MAEALALYSDPARLAAWHAEAAPGASITYAVAGTLDPSNPAVQLVAGWIAERSVAPVQCGREGARMYQVQRVAPDGGAGRLPRVGEDFAVSDEGRLFLALVDIAEAGLPCPSNTELARQLGWDGARQVRYRLDRLTDAGRVSVRNLGGPLAGRVITIIETGARTAAPTAARKRA